jgi:hypothetical protein
MTRSERQPEVILDFIFEDGLFFIGVKNIGTAPAHDVSVAFDKKFTGVEGAKEISTLPLFKKIAFLAPQKEITAFLDHSASYFRRRQPTNIRATITFKDNTGAAHKTVVKHDLRIYKDIGYVRRRNEATRKQPSEER